MADRNSTPNPATLADEQVIAQILAKLEGVNESDRRLVRAFAEQLLAQQEGGA